MAFLEDMHLSRPDLKPSVVNENRAIDFSAHYFKTQMNNRAENPLLTLAPEVLCLTTTDGKSVKPGRRLSAAPQLVSWGLS